MTWDSHDIEIQKWENMYPPYYSYKASRQKYTVEGMSLDEEEKALTALSHTTATGHL
jgi:hypothetical protein